MSSSPARRRGWVPNQHGAWAMLTAPLLVGILVSHPRAVHVPLAAFWFSGYLAFFAASQWLKSRFRRRFRAATLTYGTVTAALGLVTLGLEPGLARSAWWFVVPAAVGLWAAWRRRERAWWAGTATVAAAVLMTPVAHAAGHGSAAHLWVATAVLGAYLVGSVLFVKSMIRERGNRGFHAVSVAFHALAAALLGAVTWWLGLLMLVLTARAALLPRWRLTPLQVGLVEIVCTAAAMTGAVVAA